LAVGLVVGIALAVVLEAEAVA